MMKIHLERTGGFTGIPYEPFIDSDILDPEENEVLQARWNRHNSSTCPKRYSLQVTLLTDFTTN
jgi:hypothetical protein